ncbi:MAG: Cof-type HAD-IIB family hydrolase [Peptoniphilaceae bacterium]|uniref:Cof-type HAD-IIB family hydrolase n=1 Tax=Parvimonas sp. TaxID=1944660 RepID=UPI0025EFB5DC|nr:Cof-type HAD-IIB family hydrolase [Parvimonas sp.]MCI5997455.1 HAD family hydrolase [Parvimonas sp.]MDD7764183.1 Cof-type HAD-IIB family hydrolase [Peptoniphilaceae bacterium]MDY3050388.1 Cof-type HAD-IIB family hydrolase [Parvimonas sp.]
MLKAVCIDLDGTLLDDDKKISKRSMSALEKLIENDIEVVIATGRHFYMVYNFLKPLKKNIMVCANNGAMSRFKESNELVNVEYIEKNEFLKIFESAVNFGINPYVYVDSFDCGYHLLVKDGVEKKSHFEENIPDKKMNENTIKYFSDVDITSLKSVLCVAFLDDESKILNFYQNFASDNDIVKNIYKIPDGRSVLEFQSSKADKWIAVENYLKTKGIESSEIVSFGDEFNDKQMIKNSGLGFAMKNGIDELKKLTPHITEYTNNEDGVYFELKKVFKDILGD